MNTFPGKRSLALIFCASALLFAARANAASISFYPKGTNEGYKVSVLLDPADADINAVEGSLTITGASDDLRIEDGSSIVTLWTERPNISGSPASQSVNFSGVIPGGFTGVLSSQYEGQKPGDLFDIVIPPTETGIIRIETASAKVYLNDGEGTSLDLPVARIRFSPASGTGSTNEANDITMPEPFTIEVGRSKDIFDNKWFAAFEAKDTDSGIDHYELREIKGSASVWHTVTSPVILDDQSLTSAIEVKAVDHAGNARISHLEAPKKAGSFGKIIGTGALLLVIAGAAYIFWRRKKQTILR